MGRTVVDQHDLEDLPFFLPKNSRHKELNLRKTKIVTRGKRVFDQFKSTRKEITPEQRVAQQRVYWKMPKDTDYDTLKEQGKPCDMELHTTKIMPDMHKQAAFVRKKMLQGEGGASQVIFKYDQIRKKHAIFALVQESLKYSKLINQILEDTEFFTKYPDLKQEVDLVHLLIYDMLFGKGLDFAWPRRALSAVKRYRNNFQRALYQWATTDPSYLLPFKDLPRYARVNTIKSNITFITRTFSSRGYNLVKGLTPKQYADMKPRQFCIDPDIPNLLVFAPGTNLTGPAQTRYDIILQDKASCFSALALLDPDQPTKPRGVLDACAAPGNKTLHLAALLGQTMEKTKARSYQAKQNLYSSSTSVPLVAVEQNSERFKSLKDRIYNAYATVHCINEDFLSLRPNAFKNVTHILVDPSCSGSGMVSPLNFSVQESRKVVLKAEKGKTTSTTKNTTLESGTRKKTNTSKLSEDLESLPSDFSDGEYFSAESESESESEGEGERDKDGEGIFDAEGSDSEEEGEDWVPGKEGKSDEESESESESESEGESEEESKGESKGEIKGESEGESEEQQSEAEQSEVGQSEGKQSEGEQSEGEQSEGEQSEGEQSEGEQSEGEQSEGEQSEGKQSEGEQSEGEQSGGEEGEATLTNGRTKTQEVANSNKRELPDKDIDEFDQHSVQTTGDAELITKVEGLRKFQITALKHAFSFPAVQRIVYSTCSLYVEENEKVVEEILQQYPDFKLAPVLPNWSHRGLNVFEGGTLCARASPQDDAATGFFVACFERKIPLPFDDDVDAEETKMPDVYSKPPKKGNPPAKKNLSQPQSIQPKVNLKSTPSKIQVPKSEVKNKKGNAPQKINPNPSSKSTNKKRKLYKNPPPIVKT